MVFVTDVDKARTEGACYITKSFILKLKTSSVFCSGNHRSQLYVYV